MVLVSGYAGSGKTETGKILAEITSWALLDKDTLTRPLVEQLLTELNGDPHDRQSPLYLHRVRPLEYDCLVRTGQENLECGSSCILSAPFLHEVTDVAWLRRTRRRCQALGGELVVTWVAADTESMRQRLIARNADRDTWKIANWAEYLLSIDVNMVPKGEHFLLDNSVSGRLPLADQVVALANQLR
jgi:predicted kinase